MSWKESIKEWGGGDITFLSSDGECLIFVVVADPVLLEGKYKGKPQDRVGCPIVTDEGFVLLVTGKRVARKLSKFEFAFGDTAFMLVRRGVEGDINVKYDLKAIDDVGKTKHLFELAATEYNVEKLAAAIEAAQEVMES